VNAQNGARIKVWPGVPSALSADLQGGGGLGRVRNITYDTFANGESSSLLKHISVLTTPQ
jgi:hypothetical protein